MKIYTLTILETLEGDQPEITRVTPFADQSKAREELTKEYDDKMASLMEGPDPEEEWTEEDLGISSDKTDDYFEITDDWGNTLKGEITVADLV